MKVYISSYQLQYLRDGYTATANLFEDKEAHQRIIKIKRKYISATGTNGRLELIPNARFEVLDDK